MKKLVLAALFSGAALTAYAGEAKVDFAKADKNHDGSVDKAEAKDAKQEDFFAKADADKDGKVTADEFKKAAEHHK